ncbi:MAG: glycerate kinase [candidate division KSB1 bacterium]|nr:glycerate kinase [candidate division KSB1 bacterium]
MTPPDPDSVRQKLLADLQTLYEAGIQAVMPDRAIFHHVRRDGNLLHIGDRTYDLSRGRNYLIAFGKAAALMAEALESLIGDALTDGLAITKYGHTGQVKLQKTRLYEAGHPVPDEAGIRATREALRLAEKARKDDTVFVLISGGGSALLISPATGLTLQDKQKTTELLLRTGASIQEINTVRKHLSRVKGGQLARAIAPAQFCSLILSDVIGDPIEFIASGPTAPDTTTFRDVWNILERYQLRSRLPVSVRTYVQEGLAGKQPETPKPGDPVLKSGQNRIVGNLAQALQAVYDRARELGYNTLILTTELEGEARELAHVYAAMTADILKRGWPVSPPACILCGGEPTVTVRGSGLGGRSQELALALLPKIAGRQVTVFGAVGTDGTDGPTDAAGAHVDDASQRRAAQMGLNWLDYLQNNDSYHFFEQTGELIKTGPTQTNVMDMHILLVNSC